MALNPSQFLDVCLDPATSEADCLARMGRGDALRHYCASRGHEPLSACASRGWSEAARAILERSHFEPFEEALDSALTAAVSAGQLGAARLLRSFGAQPEPHAAYCAVEQGFADQALALAREGVFGPDGAASVLSACCARGCDAPAAELIMSGVRLQGEAASDAAVGVAEHGMQACAKAWLSQGLPIPAEARESWELAFEALILSFVEQALLRQGAGEKPPRVKPRGL